MDRRCVAWLASVMIVFTLISIRQAQSATSEETLRQYLADLQRNPDDSALRERIIRHVRTMSPPPSVPAEVARLEGGAEYAFKNAKTESDYLDAAKEYEKVLLVAPWLAADYFNCGMAYEKGGKPKSAIASFNLYLIAEPDARDAGAVQKRIGGLQYTAEKAEKRQVLFSQEVQAAESAVDRNSYGEAIMHWKKAVEIFPDHQSIDTVYFNIANDYVKMGTRIPGDLDEAYKYIQKSLDLMPVGAARFNSQRPDRISTKGIILNRRGDHASACNAWKQACDGGSETGCNNYRNLCP